MEDISVATLSKIAIAGVIVSLITSLLPERFSMLAWDADAKNGYAACLDGIDNDGDLHTDYPADPDCASSEDDDEEQNGGQTQPQQQQEEQTQIQVNAPVYIPPRESTTTTQPTDIQATVDTNAGSASAGIHVEHSTDGIFYEATITPQTGPQTFDAPTTVTTASLPFGITITDADGTIVEQSISDDSAHAYSFGTSVHTEEHMTDTSHHESASVHTEFSSTVFQQ